VPKFVWTDATDRRFDSLHAFSRSERSVDGNCERLRSAEARCDQSCCGGGADWVTAPVGPIGSGTAAAPAG
jgi:hypothetical protein